MNFVAFLLCRTHWDAWLAGSTRMTRWLAGSQFVKTHSRPTVSQLSCFWMLKSQGMFLMNYRGLFLCISVWVYKTFVTLIKKRSQIFKKCSWHNSKSGIAKNRLFWRYRKIPKISLGRAYIFQRPFLRGLFLEGLIFGGACLRREICVSNSIGLAL